MQRCEKCGVDVAGKARPCPLCQGPLSGTPDPAAESYPPVPSVYEPFHPVLRILGFFSVAIAVICGAVNILLFPGRYWSLFVLAALGCMWASLSSAIVRRYNLPKNIVWQVVILSVVAVLWDWLTPTHQGWSVTYVIPVLCIVATVLLFVLSKVLKLRLDDYLIYLILVALCGVVPVLFILFGWVTVLYPSVICAAVSLLSFAALAAFADKPLRDELRRRLHL